MILMSLHPIVANVWILRGLGANIYIIEGDEGLWFIDVGSPGNYFRICDLLERDLGIAIEDVIQGVILTHAHPDHMGNISDFAIETDAKIYIHKKDAAFLDVPKRKLVLLSGGEEIKVLGTAKIIHSPGHTPGSCAILMKRILFSGDTIVVRNNKPVLPKREFCTDFRQTILSAINLAEYRYNVLCPGHGSPILENADKEVKLASEEWKKILEYVDNNSIRKESIL